MRRMVKVVACFMFLSIRAQEPAWIMALANTHPGWQSSISLHDNPAASAGDSISGLNLHYQNHFLIPELDDKKVGAFWSNPTWGMAFGWDQSGDQRLSNNQISAQYAMQTGDNKFAGIKIQLEQWHFSEPYQSFWYVRISLGLKAAWKNGYHTTFLLNHPGRMLQSTRKEDPHPTELAFNLSRQLNKTTRACIEILTSSNAPACFKLALARKGFNNFHVLSGISVNPYFLSLGWLYRMNKLNTTLGLQYQPGLGISSAISLTYLFDVGNN